MADFNLGNMAAALSVAGGDPALAEELRRRQALAETAPPATAPQPLVPPTTNRALEVAGAAYRVPEQAAAAPTVPAQQPVAAPEVAPQVEDKAFDAQAGSRALRADLEAGQNRALELKEAQGEIAGEGAERSAEQLGELRDIRRTGREATSGRVDENRAQKQDLEKKMFAKLDEVSAKMANPPKDTMGMVMGIIGAGLAAKGNGGGAAAAQMMGQAIGNKTKQWQASIEGDKEQLKMMRDMVGLQNDDSESELDQEAKLATLAVGEYDAALKQVAAETDSKEVRRAADEARNILRNQYGAHQLDVNTRQQAAAAKAAAQQGQSAADAAIIKAIAGAPTPEAAKAIAAQYGTHGLELLGAVQKGDATQAGIEETRAKAAKEQREGSDRVRDQLTVSGLQALPGATPQDKSKAQEIASATQDLDQALEIMQRLQGSLDPNDKKTFDIQRKLALGSMNSLANAGVMNPGELEDWDKKMPMHRYDNVGPFATPKALMVDEERVIGDMRSIFKKKMENGLRTYNYEVAPTPEEAARASLGSRQEGFDPSVSTRDQARQAVSQQGRVKMVNLETGETRDVRPDLVKAYEAEGFVPNAVPAEAPAAPPQAVASATPRWLGN